MKTYWNWNGWHISSLALKKKKEAEMLAAKRCWWCGFLASVDTENTDPESSNGLIRDESTMDGREGWICTDRKSCVQRARDKRNRLGMDSMGNQSYDL